MKFTKINKFIPITTALIILLEMNSFIAHVFFPIKIPAWLIVVGLVFVLSLYKTEFGLYFILAELAIGGKGYLLDFFGVSLRMGLFAAVIIAGLINIARHKNWRNNFSEKKLLLLPFSILAIAIVFAGVNGLTGNKFQNVYADANAWLFFLLLPVFIFSSKSSKFIENSLAIIITASTWLSLKTIFFLFLFSGQYAIIGDPIYSWIRNSGVGEITYINGNNYRIFFYSQIYCLFSSFILSAMILKNKIENKKVEIIYYSILFFQLFALLISQSRSFWLAGSGTIFLMMFILLFINKQLIFKSLKIICFIGLAIIIQIFLTQFITGSIFNNRLSNMNSEPAGISRLNQLAPLTQNILQNPVFGYGFGKTLTYTSKDPRILKINQSGEYTTYAFEWGYLDIWLKMGLVGILGYLFVYWFIAKKLLKKKEQINFNNFGLLLGLLCLAMVNVFTPYLNHPLGIGFIILSFSAIQRN